MAATSDEGRKRGRIEQRGDTLRVVVYAGIDPVTNRRRYERETVKGTDDAAWKQARKVRTKLLAKVDKQRHATSVVNFDHAIAEWLRTARIADSTRDGYVGYIKRHISPVLGALPIDKIGARELENFYTELLRCNRRCDGKPRIDHKKDDDHDCVAKQCTPHKCAPMAQSTVRQIHSIISGVFRLAVRWEWTDFNPAKVAERPKQTPPEPDPPTSAEAAKLLTVAYATSYQWGTLVWLAMTTGMRRAEIAGLRWTSIDLDNEVIDIRRTYVMSKGQGKEKDTKTHQMRRIALDSETVARLRKYKEVERKRLSEKYQIEQADNMYVFTTSRLPDPNTPYSPDAISHRYKNMAERIGIKTHIHALRHYSATELLTAGVDLRTVAGRLGHGGGGATTLRVYAAWVAASDRKAAEILGSRMPRLPAPNGSTVD